jgi:hypothetical protein
MRRVLFGEWFMLLLVTTTKKHNSFFFWHWQKQVHFKLWSQVCVGEIVINYSSIWLSRNDETFYKNNCLFSRPRAGHTFGPSYRKRMTGQLQEGILYIRDHINGDLHWA